MQQGDNLRLCVMTQIDKQVAARHHIESGKRRVGQHVLHGEHDRLAQLGSAARLSVKRFDLEPTVDLWVKLLDDVVTNARGLGK